ncbi:MAG: glycerate kinase [Elusimicrobiales bacterium]
MKVLSVINSFKTTASSADINRCVEKMLKKSHTVISIPISDGGDGFVECLKGKGRIINLKTEGPFMNIKVKARYLINKEEAYIEIAEICGIKHLSPSRLNPLKATTYGVGRVIEDAIKNGAKKIYIGLGGTASNDAGCGAAYYLGVKFTDENSNEIFPDIKGILRTKNIDFSAIRVPKNIKFYAVCDVKNKLLGKYGSARVFGPQKGADRSDIIIIENALKNLTSLIRKEKRIDISKVEGGASAGGFGAGIYGFFNGKIISGSNFIMEKLDIEKLIYKSDIILTGEGRFDRTSFYGKITGEIIKKAKKYRKKIFVITAISEIKKMKGVEIIELSSKYPLELVFKKPIPFILIEIKSIL